MKKYIHYILTVLTAGVLMGCEEFLDAKPNKNIAVPESIEDLQALMDNLNVFNITPGINILPTDEYYNTQAGWLSHWTTMAQNAHLRNLKKVYDDETLALDWFYPYHQVFYANVCLEQAARIEPANQQEVQELQRITGSAKFLRAFAFFHLAQNFSVQYEPGSTGNEIGVPLPKEANVNVIVPFSTLEETYDQIFKDLFEALPLLPDQGKHKTRPSKLAAHSLLAKIYLNIGDYQKAEQHSTLALDIHSYLLDFNELNPSVLYPVSLGNDEVIYHALPVSTGGVHTSQETRIDTTLYASYSHDDLRKTLYYVVRPNGAVNFRGSFSGSFTFFSGITVGEVFLIRSEARVRLDDLSGALSDINVLLKSRYKQGAFNPISLGSKEEVLDFVLQERKKELVFRGTRWNDLKRFSSEGDIGTLTRVLDGVVYEFVPEPMNFVFPVPLEEKIQR